MAALGQEDASGDILFRLGMNYSTGRNGTSDLVEAHKWFNLAAMKGKREAVCYRQEIAAEMSSSEVAEAQRAAREWLRLH
ncbi:MAG: hypothetical protein C0606_13405 [Hyphomicrobiales bacterium]|nr:MAG: hypothetical protein C0606_13405 [Hyphomicrobiales bacterium]